MSTNTGGVQFYSALQEQAMDAVKDTFKSVLYPIQYPSQGDFKYNYQNANQIFSDDTYQYVNALISPGEVKDTAALSPGGGFANAYVQIVNSIIYSLSEGDRKALTDAQANASVQAQSIITEYQNTFGTIDATMMKEANVTTKQDYVISYVMGSQWSGKGTEAPLNYSDMANARNLKSLLPDAPASADATISFVTVYLDIMQPVNGLSDQTQNGAWIVRSLKNNAQTPTLRNGGMVTFNPNDGSVGTKPNVGWSINKSNAEIQNDLANTERVIELGMKTSQASGGQVSVSVEGQAGFSIGSWLTFSTAASGSYDMSQASGTSTDCSVSIKYEGYSMLGTSPSPWQQATNEGFYYADPIWQAVANTGQDVTGFKLLNPPAYDLGEFAKGGNFGLLTNLLISNFPTIEITYSNANFSKFQESWDEKVSGNLTLFGFIKLGSFSQGAYGSSYKEGSDNSTFTVKFSASPEVVSVPLNQKTAYVIGGAIANPGVTP